MEGEQQGIQFHQVLVVHGTIEDEPEGDQGGVHDIGPEEEQDEYVTVDFDYDELDQEPDEEKGVEEASSEPHQSKALSNFRMFQRVDTDYLRSLEEAVISLMLQLIMAKARAGRAERKVEVITQEADELAELLVRHLDD
ncbi:unnamed protein product [Lactuca saligna]|uniref:Uncharacterized protein n=1 Tax=Lactuca saligna TaxID=75948 RepID=A0AA35VI46_LACSI|nr:unnamed protein product [Lactuca saligna]